MTVPDPSVSPFEYIVGARPDRAEVELWGDEWDRAAETYVPSAMGVTRDEHIAHRAVEWYYVQRRNAEKQELDRRRRRLLQGLGTRATKL